MVNEQAKADVAAMLETVQEQMRSVAEVYRKRAVLTGSATVADKRVTVTVNADSVVIETKFAEDVDDLTYEEIAAAVTRAAQHAAAEVTRKTKALMAPFEEQRARLPGLSEFVEGMPPLRDIVPKPPKVSTAPPGSRERERADGAGHFEDMEFTDVEEFDHTRGGEPRSGVTESDW